ncbi:hypothetical protein [Blastomonas sp. UPD001]|uniref:hypothetical protein n=1 Tax=Blastomonas sp. UPD001 TaxID=2217673 RepID=UPI001300854C|nr:hypothetical protein [Blastomonas sp. UPD001]
MAFGDLPLDAPHKPNKGMEGGACNRQSCQAEPALWWNHGSHSWYCADCARDIGEDIVNRRDWEYNFQPRLGHPMFETREQMDARRPVQTPERPEMLTDYIKPGALGPKWSPRKPKSSSLERLLRKAKVRAS